MAVGRILRDFSGWTSAHGIPHIGSAQNLCLRMFWAIIFLGSTGMFIYQMTLLTQKYLSYDVTVQTELKFEERYFPAVTLCNLNPYKETKLKLVPEMDYLMVNYSQAIADNVYKTDPTNYWGFHGLNDSIAIQSRARTHLMFLASKLNQTNKDAYKLMTYQIDEFIMNCAYNLKECDLKRDFRMIVDPVYGACYTFNNQDSPLYNSTKAGPSYGLRILLKSNQTDYLAITESAGVRVAVHGQGEEAFPDAFGYNAAAGFSTSFGIKYIKTTRLPAPYGQCTDEKGTISYYYDGTYAVEGCFRSCFQDYIFKECGCYDPRYGNPDITKHCDSSKIDCVRKFSSAQSGSTGFNAISNCACPQPCSESSHGVTVSTALWPSKIFEIPECDQAKYFGGWSAWSWINAEDCRDWYSENTMMVEVYYERMNYQALSESPAYGILNLVSDTGGQLGLWMGISVITMIEFVSLLILLCIYCFSSNKHPPDGEEDDELSDVDEKAKEASSPPPPYENDY